MIKKYLLFLHHAVCPPPLMGAVQCKFHVSEKYITNVIMFQQILDRKIDTLTESDAFLSGTALQMS